MSCPIEPEVVFRSSVDVPQHSARVYWRRTRTQRNTRITGENMPPSEPFLAKPEVEIWRKPHKLTRST